MDSLNISKNSDIFILTGSGISKESGINTFRDNDGLWSKYKIEDVANPEAFANNPTLVYDFYNKRRKELNFNAILPNKAHKILYELEKLFKINIITQNIDNLHEKALSSSILHMHGELNKVRCVQNDQHIHEWIDDLTENDKCLICGSKMRPHVVWFGEIPLKIDEIHNILFKSSLFVSIGTSGEVYPASNFVSISKSIGIKTIELNLEPSKNINLFDYSIHKPATVAVEEFKNILLKYNR